MSTSKRNIEVCKDLEAVSTESKKRTDEKERKKNGYVALINDTSRDVRLAQVRSWMVQKQQIQYHLSANRIWCCLVIGPGILVFSLSNYLLGAALSVIWCCLALGLTILGLGLLKTHTYKPTDDDLLADPLYQLAVHICEVNRDFQLQKQHRGVVMRLVEDGIFSSERSAKGPTAYQVAQNAKRLDRVLDAFFQARELIAELSELESEFTASFPGTQHALEKKLDMAFETRVTLRDLKHLPDGSGDVFLLSAHRELDADQRKATLEARFADLSREQRRQNTNKEDA